MRRTNFVTKFIGIILFVFLILYLGIYLIQSLVNPLATAPAITIQAQESFFASGLIVREEQVIDVAHPIVASRVREGERVSAGQAYLTAYASAEDRERVVRRRQLEQEIAQLETHLAPNDPLRQALSVEAEIRRQIGDLSYAARQGNLEDLDARIISLRSLFLAEDAAGIAARLDYLRREYADLGAGNADMRVIYADLAGVYSSRVDGFEHIGPADLDGIGLSDLLELLGQRPDAEHTGAGKLVTSFTWRYAALVPESEWERLYEMLYGDLPNRVTVIFSGITNANVPMQVDALGDLEDGRFVAVFSSITGLMETLSLRQAEAQIIYNTFTGIRVPRGALHWCEPDPETGITPAYVFTLTVGTAEQKYVTVIYQGPDYYLVQPDLVRTAAPAALRDGNSIIIRGRNLYDGRVIR
ncbi:MAG: hypothetical protein FWD99_07555 [Oscillospiraceae bacterium]|nr:hypothetical protein [Oscillospiraceae bacterium]